MKAFRCLLALAILVSGVSCSRDPEVVKKKYVERGNEYFKNGKYREASIMYRQALKKDMRYGEAYYRLGLTELQTGRYVDAARAFTRAIELQPGNLDARTKLVDIYLAAYLNDPRRPKFLLQELEGLATPLLNKDPKSFLGLRVKGYLALAAKELKEAEDSFRLAFGVKPYATEITLPLVQTLAESGKFEEGEKLALDGIAKDKTQAGLYDWLYAQYVLRNRMPEAEKMLRDKIASNPKIAASYLTLATFYAGTQRRPEMMKVLDQLLNNPKDFPDGRMLVGDFFFRTRDFDQALLQYQEGLKNAKEGKPRFYKRLAEVFAITGKRAEAMDMVNAALKENPKDFEATSMRAAMWLTEGDPAKVQTAVNELQAAVTQDQKNFVLRYNLGRAYQAKGDVEQARQSFLEAVKLRGDYTPARLSLAQLFLNKNDFPKSLQAAEEILAYDPINAQAKLIRSSSRIGLGQPGPAREELQALLQQNPRQLDAQFQLGITYYLEKRFKEAEDVFRKMYQQAPNDPRGLIGLAETYGLQERFDQAIATLQDELKKTPERHLFRLALANMAVRGKKYELAITEYQKLLEKSPKSYDVWLRLGEVYRLSNNIPKAVEGFRMATEVNPNDTMGQLKLALIFEADGRRMDAKPLYEKILKLEPDNPVALNNLAYTLADTGGDLDFALTLAQKARAKAPQSPDIADTLGWIYIKKNLSDNAIQIFQDLTQKHPDRAVFHYHLAMALYQKGEKPQAKRAAELALKNKPSKDEEGKIRELMARIG